MYPAEYDRSKVKEWAGQSQLRALRADLARFKKAGYSGWGSEGFWALALYRLQRTTRTLQPRPVWRPLNTGLGVVKKLFTMVTHINLEPTAEIGPGTLIPHVGPIRIHQEAKIGADCAIMHVVTIGAGSRPGGAVIGDHVYLGCHTCVLGPVSIGEGSTIASGSVVLGDVPAWTTVMGVPARVVPAAVRHDAPARSPSTNTGDEQGKAALSSAEPALVAAPPLVAAPSSTAWSSLLRHADERPSAPALTEIAAATGAQRTWTWSETAAHVRGARRLLSDSGRPEEPVLIFARRTPECVAVMLAAIAERRAFSCLNPRWRWPQLSRVLAAAGARTLFVDREMEAVIERGTGAGERAGVRLVRIDVIAPDSTDSDRQQAGAYVPAADSTAAILFTSGSTGEPKGVCISEQDLAWRAQTEVGWYGLESRDVLLNLLPFSFDVGLNQILAAMDAGCETVLCESWLPTDVLAAVASRKVTGIPCVPSIWQDFMNARLAFDTARAHASLRFITISGGDLPRRHLDQIPAVAPNVAVFKTYGQTEAFRASSLPPSKFATKRTTVGGPFPGVTLCVVRADGSIATRGEVGELVHAGLGVMSGYLGDEERTAAKLHPAPFDASQKAIFTGDSAFIDRDGAVHLVGRIDQMVKILGNRVYPNEVRSLLCEVPGIRDCVVLAEKTPAGDAALVAFVKTVGAEGRASTEALRREIRDRVPGYMVPTHLIVVDELPRTSNGKPDGEALRGRAKEVVARDVVVERHANAATAEAIVKRIETIVRERIDRQYSPERQRLRDVLDSGSFIEIVTVVDNEFKIGVDLSRIGASALESPTALAEALLARE